MRFCNYILTALILLALAGTASALDYYVAVENPNCTNSGQGTLAQPWCTIQHAVGTTSPAGAGDTVYIREGVYRESVIIVKSGTENERFVIRNYPGETPVLDGREPVTGWKKVLGNNEFLTVQNKINPYWKNIYELKILKDDLPSVTDIRDFMLFEDGKHSRIARSPDQALGYGLDMDLFYPVPTEAINQTAYLLDTTILTQDDGYWDGAWVDVYSRGANNNLVQRAISSFSNNRLYFYSALEFNIEAVDSYSILNHPHSLDSPGEFAYTMNPDVGGYYTFYFWPKDVGNLADKITIPAKQYGVFSNENDYVTIDGLKIVGFYSYCIYMGANPGGSFVGGIISNCVIEDCGMSGIRLQRATYSTVEDCTVERILEAEGVGFGIFVYGAGVSNNILIQNNYVMDTARTAILVYNSKLVQLLNNTVGDAIGSHGNGMAVYINSEKILVAYNTFVRGNLAFQDLTDVVVFGNTLDYEELSINVVDNWGDLWGRTEGLHIYLQNTILGSSNDDALGFTGQDEAPYPLNYVINNIIDGSNSWDRNLVPDMSYNLYTGYGWKQYQTQHGWSLQEGEIDGRTIPLNQIFTGHGIDNGSDYTLVEGSPAIGAGKSVTALLEELGITGNNPWFPGFDFTKDKAGNPWAQTPSMGAYEYRVLTCTTNQECNDGRYCNGTETCNTGTQTCQPGTSPCTNDGYSCTQLCNEATKTCNTPNNSLCNDQDSCTDDSCIGVGGNTGTGCTYSFNTSQCNDGIACTQGDTCKQGSCQGTTQNSLCPDYPDCTNKTCTTTGCVYIPAGCAIPPDLVLHMPFDGGMQDSSGNNNHGTCTSCPTLTEDRQGNSNSAYNFDGTNDFIDITDSQSLDITGEITMAAWIKSTTAGQSGASRVISKRNTSGGSDVYALGLYSNVENPFIRIITSTGYKDLVADGIAPIGQWTHIAATYNGSNMRIYLNGIEDKSTAKTGNLETSTINLHLGDRTGQTTGRRFNGNMDEVKIYNRALTSQEILALYNEAGQECIDTPALLGFISSWKQGSLGMLSLMQKLEQWKAGTGCP